jgi:hypothetical protein
VPIPPRDFRSERSHERHGQWEGSNGYDYGEWGDWQKGGSLKLMWEKKASDFESCVEHEFKFNKIQQDSKRSQGTMFHHIPHGWSGCATHSHPQPSIPHCDEVLRCRWRKGMANASDILGG